MTAPVAAAGDAPRAALVPVRPADALFLSHLHRSAFAPAEAWSATVIALQLESPGGFGLLDPRGGMILGRAIAREAEVLTLAVEPGMRRGGIGRGLLAGAMVRARALDADAMFLEVAVNNDPAIGLYRAAGFEQVGLRRRYYADGTDALVMRVSLSAAAGL